MKFTTTIHQIGHNTGIVVPPAIRDALGSGKNPLVEVTLAGHSWRSKVATMGDKLLVGVSAEIRGITGVKGGETHEVELVLDDKPRVVEAPGDLKVALDADPVARAAWEKLAPSHKNAHVTAIEGARSAQTRLRRVQKAIAMLTAG